MRTETSKYLHRAKAGSPASLLQDAGNQAEPRRIRMSTKFGYNLTEAEQDLLRIELRECDRSASSSMHLRSQGLSTLFRVSGVMQGHHFENHGCLLAQQRTIYLDKQYTHLPFR